MNPNTVNIAALVGRILLALIFVIAGFGKISGFEGTVGYMASKGLPMPQVLLVLTILLELGGGLLLIIGWKVRWVTLAFFLWLIPTTLIFHKFWGIEAAQVQNQMNHFLKNVSIMGGMLLLWASGAGAYSLDKK
ncbi:MAG: DoxX family protein [Pseudomonadota bacterium]|nr:DoxX family protein [Pseudomonadota bacterium]